MYLFVVNFIFQFSDIIIRPSINISDISGLNNCRRYNSLTIDEEGIEALLEITEIVIIIKRLVLISSTDIDNMLNISHSKNIIVELVNKLSMRVDGGKNQDQK